MSNERRSETPVADTKLRSEINISVFLQGAMLIVMTAIGSLIWDINGKIGELAGAQKVITHEIATLKVEVSTVRDQQREDGKRIRVLEIDHAKGVK